MFNRLRRSTRSVSRMSPGWRQQAEQLRAGEAGAALGLHVGRGDPQTVLLRERLKVGAGASGVLLLV
ncbi:mll9229 (plasmid) [Mesorhizobium japonicum MAFF 303099]|uniref:Mll9229 protein n=1 Tax=Mesorhizobium japonicum (strain LMG 29417 / CECT 9101 / MAFF 303099) TaxID=266835 RepID=Q981U7_RHILO|nr:mll9229 [Mesorhizobium japonicum MAFF 303099]